ncbi:uncharacterized protein LOC135633304 [Musa acuminata AAA Group]|uniref:uncharacterized protein LOC135633304 n=1 Tax=Musa acuminata AAA Group TaxID=214697 RepID=UPI0031E0102A
MWIIQEGEEGEVKATPERTRGGSAGADETAESNGGICFIARLPILQRSQHAGRLESGNGILIASLVTIRYRFRAFVCASSQHDDGLSWRRRKNKFHWWRTVVGSLGKIASESRRHVFIALLLAANRDIAALRRNHH